MLDPNKFTDSFQSLLRLPPSILERHVRLPPRRYSFTRINLALSDFIPLKLEATNIDVAIVDTTLSGRIAASAAVASSEASPRHSLSSPCCLAFLSDAKNQP